MVRINSQKVRTYEHAEAVIMTWQQERGVDDEFKTWLVIEDDYNDGTTFTRGQIRRECEWALVNQRRYEAIVGVVANACHTMSIFNDHKIRYIARNVALNADRMEL